MLQLLNFVILTKQLGNEKKPEKINVIVNETKSLKNAKKRGLVGNALACSLGGQCFKIIEKMKIFKCC
jgi:hypothetical protein